MNECLNTALGDDNVMICGMLPGWLPITFNTCADIWGVAAVPAAAGERCLVCCGIVSRIVDIGVAVALADDAAADACCKLVSNVGLVTPVRICPTEHPQWTNLPVNIFIVNFCMLHYYCWAPGRASRPSKKYHTSLDLVSVAADMFFNQLTTSPSSSWSLTEPPSNCFGAFRPWLHVK